MSRRPFFKAGKSKQETQKAHRDHFAIPKDWPHQSELIHAAALIVGNTGILLRGPSGSGKSMLQRELQNHCAAHGLYSALVSDDYVRLARGLEDPSRLLAFAPYSTFNRQEIRGLGIRPVHQPAQHSTGSSSVSSRARPQPMAVISLVVDLIAPEEIERMPAGRALYEVILGKKIPRIAVPQCQANRAIDLIVARLST